jgi:hypothetical protein
METAGMGAPAPNPKTRVGAAGPHTVGRNLARKGKTLADRSKFTLSISLI